MYKLNPTKEALDFWNTLDAKQYRQIGRKVLSLLIDSHPNDSKALVGSSNYLRGDCGEYRIIYRLGGDTIKLVLISSRNDGDIYKKFDRKPK